MTVILIKPSEAAKEVIKDQFLSLDVFRRNFASVRKLNSNAYQLRHAAKAAVVVERAISKMQGGQGELDASRPD